ncbi:MAG: phenylalanine--tRNA ligase subunit beta, partial [Acidobacteriaceae bacterium]|nr:phenylalanine--tRNA ligase subunit beta [Acidobacteriaceae bacterium]
PRYSALVFENIKVEPSPIWLQARLQSIGLNPINNIVDVTNYVLAELPQPMHAFDADKLAGKTIYVRRAQSGQSLAALNGESYTLTENDLVIADASGPVALAGVIGGSASAISESTSRIVLESANFQAASVRLTSARHKLRTDASMRFEKSLDPQNTIRGLARAVELLSIVCPCARLEGGLADAYIPATAPPPIPLPVEVVVRKLDKEIRAPEILGLLHSLGFEATETAPGLLTVLVPSWRATKDISLADDLVEEIGRMVGYDQITPTPPLVAAVVPPSNPMRLYLRNFRRMIAGQGFTEVYNYSFVSDGDVSRFGMSIDDHIGVRNPIASELSHLRRSLLPGLFKNLLTNVRNFRDFRVFEIGSEIHPRNGSDLPEERTHAAALLYDEHGNEQDFFEMKRVVDCLLPESRVTATDARRFEHPTRAAEITWRGAVVGRLFELHPVLLEREDVEGRAVMFDLDLALTSEFAAKRRITYKPLRKFPTSGFDLSVVTDLKVPVAEIHDALTRLAGDALASIEFVRQYDGSPLPPGKKSVTYRLEVGALDHTVTAEEVGEIRNRIVEGMKEVGFDFRS